MSMLLSSKRNVRQSDTQQQTGPSEESLRAPSSQNLLQARNNERTRNTHKTQAGGHLRLHRSKLEKATRSGCDVCNGGGGGHMGRNTCSGSNVSMGFRPGLQRIRNFELGRPTEIGKLAWNKTPETPPPFGTGKHHQTLQPKMRGSRYPYGDDVGRNTHGAARPAKNVEL